MKKNLTSVNKNWTLFLDRDGVVNKRLENDYVKRPSDFEFIENVPQAIRVFNSLFKYVFIVTNQQGIGKGLMAEEDLLSIHADMSKKLRQDNAVINEIFYCPHKREDNSFYRKPNIGMALKAKKNFPDIDFHKSVMVGDSITDMQFGKRLKMTTVFIAPNLIEVSKNDKLIDYHFKSLYDLAQHLLALSRI